MPIGAIPTALGNRFPTISTQSFFQHGFAAITIIFYSVPRTQKSLKLRWVGHGFVAGTTAKRNAISDARNSYRVIPTITLSPSADAVEQLRNQRVTIKSSKGSIDNIDNRDVSIAIDIESNDEDKEG